jgi:hypothetical protein
LGIGDIDRLALDEFLVVGIDHLFGALFGALTAGDAFVNIYVAGD